MDRIEILNLSKKINFEDLEKAKAELDKNYYFSYGKYSEEELKKALIEKNPVIIKEHFLVGFDPDGKFVDIDEKKIPIERMVKAIIVEGLKDTDQGERDFFAIIGKNEWDDISHFRNVFETLYVGEVFLPPHSAIFNFLSQTEEMKKKRIVSMLEGVNINIYVKEDYVDNAFHEIGHLFWRDCLNYEEKQAFKNMFKVLRPSAIYEYEWERETEEEVFATVYKWYMKSLLLNKAFYNILEFEEPNGLKLLLNIFDRIRRDRQIADIWGLHRREVLDYLNPRFDVTSGKYLRKAGAFDRIRDIEIPAEVLQNVERYEGGIEFVRLEKAVVVPVKGGLIDWENMEKAKELSKINKVKAE